MGDHRAPDSRGAGSPEPVDPTQEMAAVQRRQANPLVGEPEEPVDTGFPEPDPYASAEDTPGLQPTDPPLAADEPRPEPVLDAAKLAGLVSALVVAMLGIIALVVAGNVLGDMTALSNAISSVIVAVSALVAYLTPVWQGRKARAKVTPLADPRDTLGRALTIRGR